ncbi:hypothetical protein EA462_04720 [Natrarchaeobius halalkaliphilus]|uniref:Uncharacterized protein n=1 Tax=Natrarchaeobius halalkaliphilus TaxID=1679091 RepID=A0A3N6LUP5_9EURY|nr:hypothetical protein [Natrarchaeobius halalkaliphilus]RQG91294.1 hypothetical protein EA462_04720 [Natrarchaeobius halalkaliphilus]
MSRGRGPGSEANDRGRRRPDRESGRRRREGNDRSPSRRSDSRFGGDDGRTGRRRLGVAFVVLVGLSGTTMALQGGASPSTVGLATAVGLIAGGALLWYLIWMTR